MIKIITLYRMNKNSRYYQKENFDNINYPVLITWGIPDEENQPQIVGEINHFRLEENELYADVHIFKNETLDKISAEEIIEAYRFVPFGEGRLDKNGAVIDYSLKYINLIPKNESSFEQ